MAISDYPGNQIAAYHFEYDSLGRLIRSTEYGADNTITQRTEHLYDAYNRLSAQSWIIEGDSFSESYTYNDPSDDETVARGIPDAPQDGSLKQMTTASGDTIDYSYDALKRLDGTTVKNSSGTTILTNAYAYRDIGTTNGITQTTTQVEFHNVRNASGTVISGAKYTYDEVGNIIGVYESTGSYRQLVAYTYDVQNQLLSETYYTYNGTSTVISGRTIYSYTYDTAGNILTESKNGTVTKTYTYGNSQWNDLLTAYNGTTITYDTIGNPISYNNGQRSYYMQWEQGRQLSYMAFEDGQGQYQTAYDYDVDGIRTTKLVDNVTHKYITQNGKVVRETIGSGTTAKVLDFIYDESGRPFALKYSTDGGSTFTTYYYVLNLQGDVVKLVEHTRTGKVYNLATVANYTYNAWGEILSITDANGTAITDTTHISHINPLRYRGYYYDTETGFYYLQSRYYDPVMHRFINADSLASTGQGIVGTNMFAYCGNNPVCRIEIDGNWWLEDAWDWACDAVSDFATDVGEVLYDIGDGTIELLWDIASVFVDIGGYDLTAELLSQAATGDGGKYWAYEGSYASELCKNDVGICEKINSILLNCSSEEMCVSGYVGYEIPLSNGDLGAALHNVILHYEAVRNNKGWSISVCVMDTFDFTEFKNPFTQSSFKKGMLWFANDLAYIDSQLGFLEPVYVRIWFSYSLEVP